MASCDLQLKFASVHFKIVVMFKLFHEDRKWCWVWLLCCKHSGNVMCAARSLVKQGNVADTFLKFFVSSVEAPLCSLTPQLRVQYFEGWFHRISHYSNAFFQDLTAPCVIPTRKNKKIKHFFRGTMDTVKKQSSWTGTMHCDNYGWSVIHESGARNAAQRANICTVVATGGCASGFIGAQKRGSGGGAT